MPVPKQSLIVTVTFGDTRLDPRSQGCLEQLDTLKPTATTT